MLQSIIVTILVQYCYNLTHKNKFKIFNSLFNCVYFSVKFLRYYNLKHDPHRQAVRHAFFRAVIFFSASVINYKYTPNLDNPFI